MLITGAAIIYSRCFWLQMMRWWSIWHVNLQQKIYQKFFSFRSNQLWRQCSVWYDCEVWAVGDSCQGCDENVIISVTNVQINNTTLVSWQQLLSKHLQQDPRPALLWSNGSGFTSNLWTTVDNTCYLLSGNKLHNLTEHWCWEADKTLELHFFRCSGVTNGFEEAIKNM